MSAEPVGCGMRPIHPGEILGDELVELGLSARAFAKALEIPVNRVTQILNGRRGAMADTALRLARYFGTSAGFWMDLQSDTSCAAPTDRQGDAIACAVGPVRPSPGGLWPDGALERRSHPSPSAGKVPDTFSADTFSVCPPFPSARAGPGQRLLAGPYGRSGPPPRPRRIMTPRDAASPSRPRGHVPAARPIGARCRVPDAQGMGRRRPRPGYAQAAHRSPGRLRPWSTTPRQ
jgi:addiction module HigA family antidote